MISPENVTYLKTKWEVFKAFNSYKWTYKQVNEEKMLRTHNGGTCIIFAFVYVYVLCSLNYALHFYMYDPKLLAKSSTKFGEVV